MTPPADLATCRTDADCMTVLAGCYCGAQPARGVARRYADAAARCEVMAADTCALGCITTPGFVAQDGRTVAAQASIAVRCEAATACKTYVP